MLIFKLLKKIYEKEEISIYKKKFKGDDSKQYYCRLLRLQLVESLSVSWIGLTAQQLILLLLPLSRRFQQLKAYIT